MANTLKAKVDINTSSAERKLKNLMKQINKVNAVMGGNVSTLTRTNNLVNNVANSQRKHTNAVKETNNEYKKSINLVGGIEKKIKGLAATYLGVMGAKAMINTSDIITGANNRMNNVNATMMGDGVYDANGNYTSAVTSQTQADLDKMYASAQRSRSLYTDTIANVSKLMTLAGDAFKDNTDNAIAFQETMAKAYTVGGASAAEQASSMYQMVQALGSGILQGDELRSVREGAPLAYQAIEEFAQGVYNTDESLKELASEGKITSDIVVAAMMDASDGINKAFEASDMTFAQAFNQIKNHAVKAFEPVLKMLNQALNSDFGKNLISGITMAISIVAKAIQFLFNIIASVYNFMQAHSKLAMVILMGIANVIMYMLYPAVSALIANLSRAISMVVAYAVKAIASAIASIPAALAAAASWLAVYWPLALIIAVLAIIIVVVYIVADSFTDACGIIVGIVFAVGSFIINLLQLVVNLIITGVMLVVTFIHNIIYWIVELFVALANAIITRVLVTKAVITNVIYFIANLANGLASAISAICTNIGIFFQNAFYAAEDAFWSFISNVLEGLSWLEQPLNAIAKMFGLEGISISGVIDYANAVSSKAKDSKQSYVDVGDAFSKGMNTYAYESIGDAINTGMNALDNPMERWQYGDAIDMGMGATGTAFEDGWLENAYNTGYGYGEAGGNWISDKVGGIKDSLSPTTGGGTDALNVDDYMAGMSDLDGSGTGKNIGKIADNTDNIKDSVDIADTELKYLRDLAERDAINKFTTAEIKVDMTNNNTLTGTRDIDGIISALSDKLYEELGVVADGVHY